MHQVLNIKQEAVPKHPYSYIIGKFAIAWKSALSDWMLCTGYRALQLHSFMHSDSYLTVLIQLAS